MSMRPENDYDAGRFDERAAIVAWLREQHDMRLRLHDEAKDTATADYNLFRAAAFGGAADAIEQATHLRT